MKRSVLALLAAIAVLTGALTGCAGKQPAPPEETAATQNTQSVETGDATVPGQTEPEVIMAPDFILTDQYGNEHMLSAYRGKTVFLNFWATWCPPCRGEMPDIQALYEEFGSNEGDLIVLGVATPNVGQEGDEEAVKQFLSDNGYTFPVVMDHYSAFTYPYGIQAYPTTFMISADGSIFGYVTGALTDEVMHDIVRQTMDAA